MADDGKTTEEIILELKTNFEKELNKATAQYSNFVVKIGDISRGVEKSFSSVSKSAAVNIRNMTSLSIKEVTSAISANRMVMSQVIQKGLQMNKVHLQSFDKILAAQEKYRQKILETEKDIAIVHKNMGRGKAVEKYDTSKINEIREIQKVAKQELNATIGKINDAAAKRLGEQVSKASLSYVRSAESNLISIKNIVRDINKQNEQVASQLNMQSTALGKFYKQNDMFNKMKTQQAEVQKQLVAQAKVAANAEKEVANAELAVRRSVDAATMESNRKVLRETIANNIKVQESYSKVITVAKNYDAAVGKVENSLREMGNAIRKSISGQINPKDMNSKMKQAMDLLVQYAQNTGKGMSDALSQSIIKGKKVEESLEKDIQKLKELKSQALQLQKTGLIDTRAEVLRIDSVMKKYNQFFADYRRQQQSVQATLGKKANFVKTGGVDLSNIKTQYDKAAQAIKNLGEIQENNVLEAQAGAKKLESIYDKYLSKRKVVADKIIQLQERIQQTEIEKTKITNEALLAEYDKYQKQLQTKLKIVQNILTRSFEPSSTISDVYKKIGDSVAATQKRIQNDWLKNNDYVEKNFRDIEESYARLLIKAEKLSKKRFVSKNTIQSAQAGFNQLKQKAEEYEANILKIQNEIRKLESLQKKGMGSAGIQKQTEMLRENLVEMRKHTQTLNNLSTQAQRNIDRLHKKTLGSITKGAWEMVRNFRWQVAAVIYLITRAVNAVKRVFFNIMNEIMEYQKNAMSIAASVSYSMLGNVQKNYKKAYQYSRQLMIALEMEAARTILTLEDMLMLTKTFAQAGIVPDTKEDVRRISTIGTAIKALTEGMANAGVQMRQEIYAVIAGRQRATDQLQMMFRMVGVDIKRIIAEGKKEGKDMIEVLATALEPFEEMNKMMQNSYQTAINKLKTIWSIIKRLAGETVLDDLAKSINTMADALYDSNEKVLTTFGEDTVRALRAALRTLYETGKSIFQIVRHILSTIGEISSLFYTAGANAGLWKNHVKNTANVYDGLIVTLKLVAGIMKQIEYEAENFLTALNAGVKSLSVVGNVFKKVFTGDIIGLSKKSGEIKKQAKEAYDEWKKYFNLEKVHKKDWEEFQKVLESIGTEANNITSDLPDLGKRFKLPYDVQDLMKTMDKVSSKIKELSVASESGPQKFQIEYEVTIADFSEAKEQLMANIIAVKSAMRELKGTEDDFTDDQKKQQLANIKYWQENVNKIIEYEALALKKRDKQLSEYYDKQRKQQAQMKRQAETFMLELSGKPETMEEKTKRWYDLMKVRLDELAETNNFVAKSLDEYRKALKEGLRDRQEQDAEKIAQEYEQFEEQITSHRILNEFEKIDNEMAKIAITIEKAINFTDEQKQALRDLVNIAKEERVELERKNQMYVAIGKELDVMSAKASYLMNSFSPKKQQQGAIMELRAAYLKSLIDIEQEMERVNQQYKDEEGSWKPRTQEMQRYAESLKQEYREIQTAFERDLWRKQNPLWNDMIEMSNNWADGLSDSLTDLVLDFENFGESIKSLWESIVRDMLKATIKRKMIEPLMGGLGSGEPSSGNILQSLFGGGKGGAGDAVNTISKVASDNGKTGSTLGNLLGTGQPLPVYIVDTPGIEGLTAQMDAVTNSINQKGNETKEAIGIMSQSNDNLLTKMLSAMWTSTSNTASSIWGGTKDLFGKWFGSEGNTAESVATNISAYGMADGGTIKEHIVGRGLSSNKIYQFGENSKYGEFEDVIPRRKMQGVSNGQHHFNMSMPININAIDTQTGVDFIVKHQKTIETNMLRSFKNNKAIRGMVRQTR